MSWQAYVDSNLVGTGKIGAVFTKIMHGFGCKLLGYDVFQNKELPEKYGLQYVPLNDLLAQSDIISLHLPLLPSTYHMINADTVKIIKKGAFLVNTSRGGIIDTPVLVKALKSGDLGAVGLDVYEGEKGIFFSDLSSNVLADDTLARLISMPNVLITGHQAFFTKEAQDNIVATMFQNLDDFLNNRDSRNEMTKTVGADKNKN